MARKKKPLVIAADENGVFHEATAAMDVPAEVSTGLDGLEAQFTLGAPQFPAAPSIEDRLLALEAKLSEAQSLVTRQAAVIVVAAENAERLGASRAKCKRLEDAADEAKKAASEAKKRYETAVSDHFELEEELASGQGRLPFTAAIEEPTATPVEVIDRNVQAMLDGEPEPIPEPDDESWRAVTLYTLDELSTSNINALQDNNIYTVGQLSDYMKPSPSGYCQKLTDLNGIGNAKAEQIENALMAFWPRWAAEQRKALEATTLQAVRDTEAEQDAAYTASLATVLSDPSANGDGDDWMDEPAMEPDDADEPADESGD